MEGETREIKFRVWDSNEKVMRYSDPDNFDENSIHWAGKHNFWYRITRNEPGISEVMQCTNLIDKNGKEIYEGDMVKFILDYDSEEPDLEFWEVIYDTFDTEDGDVIGFCLKNESYYRKIGFEGTFIVAGNIYENQDLLK